MSQGKFLRAYDYINQPYKEVAEVLKSEGPDLFQRATTSTSARVESLAGELHFNLGAIQVGTEIEIRIKKIVDQPKDVTVRPSTTVYLEWNSIKLPKVFPVMYAELSAYPITPTETQLDFQGLYKVPLGIFGEAFDSVLGHHIAEASVHHFIRELASHLRSSMSYQKSA